MELREYTLAFHLYDTSSLLLQLCLLISCMELNQVEQEFIYYVHDNTETLEDSFTVTANDTDLRKHSAPWTVYVQVIAVNDESPVVTANKVLRVR